MEEKPLLGLCMIVKNEEHVIERAIRSASHMIDTFCIIDTGSTDKTKEIIQKVVDKLGIKGFIYDRPWVNFGHNRSEALELSRNHMKWALVLDADDTIKGEFNKNLLNDKIAGYNLNMVSTNSIFNMLFLVNLKYNWKFIGVTHEYSKCLDENVIIGKLPDTFSMLYTCDGNRNQSNQKFLNDISLLENNISNIYSKSREIYYLGQSYANANMPKEAYKYLKLRTKLKGWNEEIYVSYLFLIDLTDDYKKKVKYAWKAQNINPKRKEAVYKVLLYTRKKEIYNEELYSLGFMYKDNIINTSNLFSEVSSYGWQYYEEFALHAYYTKHYNESHEAFIRAINLCDNKDEIIRLQNGLNFCKDKIDKLEEIDI